MKAILVAFFMTWILGKAPLWFQWSPIFISGLLKATLQHKQQSCVFQTTFHTQVCFFMLLSVLRFLHNPTCPNYRFEWKNSPELMRQYYFILNFSWLYHLCYIAWSSWGPSRLIIYIEDMLGYKMQMTIWQHLSMSLSWALEKDLMCAAYEN